jgi:hypothetical protein
MTGKEKQKEVIKDYLKPTLKDYGFKTSGQTWWKDKGEFFTLINLQNFSWNSKDNVDFCFNIGIAIKANMKNIDKPTVHDLTVYLREDFYLTRRLFNKFRNKIGYTITDKTNLDKFIKSLRTDFEDKIIPYLDNLNSIKDCIDKFGDIKFWGDNLKKVIKEHKIQIQ